MFDDRAARAWLDDLNGAQRAAATHAGGPLLILAGAGTGKTTTLCSRMAWLLSEGIPAERILLLTFMRRAAREMVRRARALAERAAPQAGPVVGGTFHSVAHRMVRLHASSLGLDPGFGLLDAADAADLLDLVREDRGQAQSRRRFPRAQTMLDIYSRTVNSQAPLAEMLAESFPWCAEHREALAESFRAYGARKRALGVLDLDDLLLYWRALARDEVVGAAMGDSFEHVLVDEYQDVNGIQVDIVRSLRGTRRELTVVGDDFQAIYGFRAASARHILDFPEHFPDACTIKLEQNYRSAAPILAVANAVSAQDESGYPKTLWTEREGGQAPVLCFPRDEGAQAHEVCERVSAAREQGMELRRQAVLFRTGHDSDLLELELARRGIPFVKYGGLRFLDAAHVKDLIALLRLCDNPADEVSWFRVLQLLDGVGPVRARRALDALQAPGGRAPSLDRWPQACLELPDSARAPAVALLEALACAHGADAKASSGALVEQLCEALAPLITARYEDGRARVSDLDQLAAAARSSESVRQFVSELVLDPPCSSADLARPPHLDEDYLVLSTVHSAKGLEWEAVHVIGAYDGNFPADMNAASEEGIAEERRLLYVALTRARRLLQVYVPSRYFHRPRGGDDAHGLGSASRFLSVEVQRLFEVVHDREPVAPLAPAPQPARRTIAVSVDALFS
ncbi:MAG: ATP-dependent helicase [Actinobacteria bacterium]|nr:MAG: ATP-dependent helicase [Actinomycetota bacterium]